MSKKPNVIFIYADDLGRGLLSCYGQKYFKTPNIDALCHQGLNFTNAHGCHICAPARASLLCGIHDSHCGGWFFTKAGIYVDYAKGELTLPEVYELIHNTGIEKRSESEFLPMLFNKAGYMTGQIGKLEWGFATTGDELDKHGWQYHYGYYDHQQCHGYFPPFMFENGKRVDIPGNTNPDCGKFSFPSEGEITPERLAGLGCAAYNQDLFDGKILDFLRANKDRPFFLYHPSTLPHGVLSVTALDPQVKDDDRLTFKEKVYASMVLRLDATVGMITRELEALGIADNTMIVFSADNGHAFYYGSRGDGNFPGTNLEQRKVNHLDVRYDSVSAGDIFDGNNGMSGCKTTNLEGGNRVPLMIKWPGVTAPGTTSRALVANYDFYATVADLFGFPLAPTKDGVSYLPLLEGRQQDFEEHEFVVFAGDNGPAIIGRDGFKLRTHIHDKNLKFQLFGDHWDSLERQTVFELYDLNNDYTESDNIIDKYPERARELTKMLMRECDGNLMHGTTRPHYVFYNYNYEKKKT